MKIAIVNNQVPFVYGGAEFLADWLRERLSAAGHSCEVIRLPFKWNPPQRIVEHMLAARLVKLPTVDRVIALKFPAYYVEHDNKVLWLLHQFRQAYDLWGTSYQELPNTPEGLAIRTAITNSDNRYLRLAKKLYTNSSVVSARLSQFNGISSAVLYPPLKDERAYRCDHYGDYILCAGRVNEAKRPHLLVEAMRFVKSAVRLIVAGKPESQEYSDRLVSLVKAHHLESKVDLHLNFVSEEDKILLYAGALATAYIPYDEDSYGYVSLESFHSRKAVITCNDSGGILDIVTDSLSGYVVSPTPCSLSKAMDLLMLDRTHAEQMGDEGLREVVKRNISWDTVIRSLTA
jgi:glycosyltransferase involved in cell wall biosynthesis